MKALAKPWSNMICLLALTAVSSYYPAKITQRFFHSLIWPNSGELGQTASPGSWQGFLLAYTFIAWLALSAVAIPLCGQWRIGADESMASREAFKVLVLISSVLAWIAMIMLFWELSTFGP